MAHSPAKAHYQTTAAALAAAATGPADSMAGRTVYEQQLAQLLQDQLRLKQVQSTQGKAELKRQLLGAYESYVAGVLEAGNGAQDQVLTTVMVWRIDAGDFWGALDIAAYVLKHGLLMPDRFARTTGCLIAEEVATAALNAQKAGQPFEADLLFYTEALTAEQDMPDEARAKLYLAIGRAELEGIDDERPGSAGQLARGIAALQRAISLHDRCGGKKDLERAERLAKKHAATSG
ncbi:phage terminase small subunit [Pseudomonas oryzihabitans]|uniref:phage terminase small subunit n=1 Tax=Pseudomonas oryzihabitans TaxID=47885 RepID=UPI0028944D65|nr:phage terminase small subunit [Pseudomonas oryzihabitans]MDT3722914.1 phage terminase small subunit [Pseudomonas oryzihabitans]